MDLLLISFLTQLIYMLYIGDMSHTYLKLNTKTCQPTLVYMAGFGASAQICGTLAVSYSICMKTT